MSNEDLTPDEVAVPICEICYLIENTLWEPESVDDNGQVVMRLTEIVVPDKINTKNVEICEDCGSITIAGIYELRTPQELAEARENNKNELWKDDDPTSFILDLYPETEEY